VCKYCNKRKAYSGSMSGYIQKLRHAEQRRLHAAAPAASASRGRLLISVSIKSLNPTIQFTPLLPASSCCSTS
jgi:hypothetical protein